MTTFFDPFRRKSIILTPEERVRQSVLLYLQQQLQVPTAKIAVEGSIKWNDNLYRYDILVYNPDFQPLLLVECKAKHIPIHQDVLYQLARYNIILQVPFLMATNTQQTLCCKVDDQTISFLEVLPSYENMANGLAKSV